MARFLTSEGNLSLSTEPPGLIAEAMSTLALTARIKTLGSRTFPAVPRKEIGAWMEGRGLGCLGKMEGLGWRRQQAGDTVKHVEIQAIEPFFFFVQVLAMEE
jgi:hypothetical protein